MKRRDFVASIASLSNWLANSPLPASARANQGKEEKEIDAGSRSGISVNYKRGWKFDKWGDKQGWTVPSELTGAVMGGGLWLTFKPAAINPEQVEQTRFQIYGPGRPFEIESPRPLEAPASQVKKVRMRILNLSPVTDGYVDWKTKAAPDRYVGAVRFTLQPNANQWQEVACHIDERWTGTIDQLKLRFPTAPMRGDIWINSIELVGGMPREQPPRPDVCGDSVVPGMSLPGISQNQFADAFKVLDECLITNVPVFGFNYPVMGPGGAYGECWWQLDSSLAVAGAKWANQEFAENVMRGFKGVQELNPDGRIDLYGDSAIRGQIGDVSSLPRFFEVAYDVARRTNSNALREEIYLTMKKYLGWWLSPVKRDAASGLITATGEETLSGAIMSLDANQMPQTDAPMDLNVAVALGCYNVGKLAGRLGKADDARQFNQRFQELTQSINRYLWNEQQGAYYNYNVRDGKQSLRLICTTFDPLRLQIAPPPRVKRLLSKLLNPALFNWGALPVTTIAKTESDYVEEKGTYNGRQWYGDVWAMRNLAIVAGLEDVGCHGLAAELAWTTIKGFNADYTEYLVPSTGQGDGVKRYAWSASLYIQAIVEHLFGVDYDRMRARLRIAPRVPPELVGQEISLGRLIIPTGDDTRLSLRVKQTAVGKAEIAVEISGVLPKVEMEVLLPTEERRFTQVTDEAGRKLPIVKEAEALPNVVGVRMPIRSSVALRFE
jgi:hypothetical protein